MDVKSYCATRLCLEFILLPEKLKGNLSVGIFNETDLHDQMFV